MLDLPGTLRRLRQAGSAMGHLPEDKLGRVLGVDARLGCTHARGTATGLFGRGDDVRGAHEDQPYLDAHGWESHAGSLRVVWVDGTHPDLVNPAYIPQIVAEAFDSGPAE